MKPLVGCKQRTFVRNQPRAPTKKVFQPTSLARHLTSSSPRSPLSSSLSINSLPPQLTRRSSTSSRQLINAANLGSNSIEIRSVHCPSSFTRNQQIHHNIHHKNNDQKKTVKIFTHSTRVSQHIGVRNRRPIYTSKYSQSASKENASEQAKIEKSELTKEKQEPPKMIGDLVKFQKIVRPVYSPAITTFRSWTRHVGGHMYRIGIKFWEGSKQLYRNTKKHYKLYKTKPLEKLSRKELLFIRTNKLDLQVLVPFFIIWRVPIFGDPLLLWVINRYPSMLPSTFKLARTLSIEEKTEKIQVQISKYQTEHPDSAIDLTLYNSLQNTSSTADDPKKNKFWKWGGQVPLTADNVLQNEEMFSHFKLEDLDFPSIRALSAVFGITAFGFEPSFWLRRRIRQHFEFLWLDDTFIVKEGGPEKLSFEELREACFARGMKCDHMTKEELATQLQNWIQISQTSKALLLTLSVYVHLHTPHELVLQ